MQNRRKKILVFAQGTIGDMITAMPAMKRICDFHAGDIVHLHNTYPGKNDVHKTLFDHLDWFDEMHFTRVEEKLWQTSGQRIKNWIRIFGGKYDIIYDIPGNSHNAQWLLRSFSAGKLCTLKEIEPDGVPRFRFLLNFLADCGIPRIRGDETPDLEFSQSERDHANHWYSSLNIPQKCIPFAMCTGGKSPLQHWPLERYAELLKTIVPKYNLFPIFFGGTDDLKDADFLISECTCGIFAGNDLTLREKILAIKKCRFYLGNDTGVMHLAGAAGIGGIGIFSSRAPDNYWQPVSGKFLIAAADVSCKGCRNTICRLPAEDNCISKISVQDILYLFSQLIKDSGA